MAVVPLYDTLGLEAMVHILNLGEKSFTLKYENENVSHGVKGEAFITSDMQTAYGYFSL